MMLKIKLFGRGSLPESFSLKSIFNYKLTCHFTLDQLQFSCLYCICLNFESVFLTNYPKTLGAFCASSTSISIVPLFLNELKSNRFLYIFFL